MLKKGKTYSKIIEVAEFVILMWVIFIKKTMKQFLLFSLFLLSYAAIIAQEPDKIPAILERYTNKKLLNYNMDMPINVNGEQFKAFALRLERFYNKFGGIEELSFAVLLKYFLLEDLYLLLIAEQQ